MYTMNSTNAMDDRKKLLMKLSACRFAQYELMLFLDTHPNCVEAMQALNMHRTNAIRLKDEYECKYGPLSNPKANMKHWCWIDDPWPWEYSSQTVGCGCFTPSMGARNANDARCGKGACQ